MSSGKDVSKDKLSRVVRFTQTETDQVLGQAIEQALDAGNYANFSELCKQALQQLLLAPASPPVALSDLTKLQKQVTALQQRMRSLQVQLARLEGAMGMQQTLSLGTLEQRFAQLEERLMQKTAQLSDRVSQMELHGVASPASEPDLPPADLDPLLSRLVPLLEDF